MPEEFGGLDAAVRRLYEAFAARPRDVLDFCAHCVSPHDAQSLVKTPLRDLDADLLRDFVFNAVSWTWGEPDDLWYYLPRVLEFVATGEFGRSDIKGMFSALSTRWRDWPQDQQDALTDYLAALWRASITGYWHPGKLDVVDVLKAAGDLGVPLNSYLGAWETAGEPAALHLAWLVRHGLSRIGNNPSAEWSLVIRQWLTGPAPRRVLASALATPSTQEVAANLSGALAILDSLAWPA
jgi:hypothetical protein